MKINLLPLKYGEHIPAASTPLNIIQRGYKVLLAACAAFAKIIQDAAEQVPEKIEDRNWTQCQLLHKIRMAQTDLNEALCLVACHDARVVGTDKIDINEMTDWVSRSRRDREHVRSLFYTNARSLKLRGEELKLYAKFTEQDDGRPDPLLSNWGWCGCQRHDY
jgi:hypothetical protein